ncbi:MAG TPA: glycine C-acetyltransferase [Armatimonadetes bacterium]|nr:glycine C-acetyltransferase [Armatimonadota bacterium]
MLPESFAQRLNDELDAVRAAGLYKDERIITSPQQAVIETTAAGATLNLCANNSLGLANPPALRAAAAAALDRWGLGLASVRFICGTQGPHRELEARLAEFLGLDEAILYTSCFDANGGLFEPLLDASDAIFSDALNHASIIDGVRLCKAQRYRYANGDLDELESQLRAAKDARTRLIITDGVFSMDGLIADLAGICDLADRYDALVAVDDSHAVGFLGARGRGSHEHCGVLDRVDIITGTLGKALGGASGGYTAARGPIVELLRQRSRPYLFSNTLAPPLVAAALAALDLLEASTELRDRLETNTAYFRGRMTELGFNITPGVHPIVPVMVGDAALAGRIAAAMLNHGVYVIGFSYPVVPQDKARIRCQISAVHSRDDLDRAVDAFVAVREELGWR